MNHAARSLFLSLALIIPVIAQSGPGNDVIDGLTRLHWTAENGGQQTPTTTLFQPPARPGSTRITPAGFPIHKASFPAPGVYKAEFVPEVRVEGTFVSFNLSGKAAETPDDATKLTVDGATITYLLDHRPDGRTLIQAAASSYDYRYGEQTWVRLNIIILPQRDLTVLRGPRLALRFHPVTNTYDVYVNNMISSGQGLGLPPRRSDTPAIELSTGTCPSPVVLTSLRIGSWPSGSAPLPVDANGHLLHRGEAAQQNR